jgi:hypothetical protein
MTKPGFSPAAERNKQPILAALRNVHAPLLLDVMSPTWLPLAAPALDAI